MGKKTANSDTCALCGDIRTLLQIRKMLGLKKGQDVVTAVEALVSRDAPLAKTG